MYTQTTSFICRPPPRFSLLIVQTFVGHPLSPLTMQVTLMPHGLVPTLVLLISRSSWPVLLSFFQKATAVVLTFACNTVKKVVYKSGGSVFLWACSKCTLICFCMFTTACSNYVFFIPVCRTYPCDPASASPRVLWVLCRSPPLYWLLCFVLLPSLSQGERDFCAG